MGGGFSACENASLIFYHCPLIRVTLSGRNVHANVATVIKRDGIRFNYFKEWT